MTAKAIEDLNLIIDEDKRPKYLLDDGLISDGEFDTLRRKALGL